MQGNVKVFTVGMFRWSAKRIILDMPRHKTSWQKQVKQPQQPFRPQFSCLFVKFLVHVLFWWAILWLWNTADLVSSWLFIMIPLINSLTGSGDTSGLLYSITLWAVCQQCSGSSSSIQKKIHYASYSHWSNGANKLVDHTWPKSHQRMMLLASTSSKPEACTLKEKWKAIPHAILVTNNLQGLLYT